MLITWGKQIPIAVSHSMPAMGVVSSEGDIYLSRTSPRLLQYNSGSGVTHSAVLSRVETAQLHIPESAESPGPVYSRPLCFNVEQPASTVCELETGSLRNGNGCLPGQVDGFTGLCLPTIFFDREVPAEDSPGGCDSGSNSPSVAHSSLVSLAAGYVGTLPNTVTQSQEPSPGPLQSGPPPARQ